MSTTQRLYEISPVFIQNAALTLFGIRYRWLRLGGDFPRYVAEFAERQTWSAERMREYCEHRLRDILLSAFVGSPYYRKRWREAGVEAGDLARFSLQELSSLPLTPKQDVRQAPEQLVSQTRPTARSRLIETRTSGTTGTPLKIYVTVDMIRQFMAVREVRSFGWAGVSIKLPRSTIGARLIVPGSQNRPPFHRYNLAEKQVYLSAFHLSPGNISHYVEALNKHRPQVLTGFAHSHYLMARMMREAGLQLSYQPQAAILGSEKVWPHMKDAIRDVFQAPVFEEYGSVENCALATECSAGRLHVSPDFGIVEIVDDRGQPVPAGVSGRVVCTGLVNDVQPLVRYDIGDLAAWASTGCTCGLESMPVLEAIVGRENDAIVTMDGRTIVGCDEIFGSVDSVIEGQIVQHSPSSFTIRVVPGAGFGPEARQRLFGELRKRVGPVEVEFETLETIPRSATGKFKPVLSELSR